MIDCPACSAPVPASARFCPTCGSPADDSRTPTRLDASRPAGPALAAGAAPAAGQGAPRGGSAGRFLPGTILAGRYRIVGLLGRGGMGEVYRADDLRLGQPVALKFLPQAVGGGPGRLGRFHAEVRLARQVSHPNVCRVYDVGEADGQPFLSMEFVDGEDLASLLRRIGRLPSDKAVQFARQLCAGLAAAHDAGVLHRDLKPANVMIDGRGRARITDFGLAAIAGNVEGLEVLSGTPDYMSPEQLSGREVTTKSDLYALGLVLYETFTGKSPFERGRAPAEAARARTTSTARSPSSVLDGLDPAVERAILRCLEKDPQKRPPSALAVAAALPGGDPLAAALAAGETPSPEMVAAAGEEGRLAPKVGWSCVAIAALGILGLLALEPQLMLVNRVPMDKPAEVLADHARELLKRLGHDVPVRDDAWSFDTDDAYLNYVRDHDRGPHRWDGLPSGRPAALFFWYRQSPENLVAKGLLTVVYAEDPPATLPGMAGVRLDTHGRLLGLDIVPTTAPPGGEGERDPDWSPLFAESGLDASRFKPVPPGRLPRVFCDRRAAWEGTFPELPAVPVRLEAGAYQGRIVHFEMLGPWSRREEQPRGTPTPLEWLSRNLALAMLISTVVAGIVLARRNLRMGRGDRSGALKLALYFLAVHAVVWAIWTNHVPDLEAEWEIFARSTGWTLFNAVLIWLFYLGLEPFVRRRWPDTIISWSRVLAGRFRDPLVGRDILIGSAFGAGVANLILLVTLVPGWLGRPPAPPGSGNPGTLVGFRGLLGALIDLHVHTLLEDMQLLFLMLILCVLLRRESLGLAAAVALFTVVVTGISDAPWVVLPLTALPVTLAIFAVRRFGLLAATVMDLWIKIALTIPFTPRWTAWYGMPTAAAVVLLAIVALYGFRVSLAGQPALRLMAEEAT